MKAALSSLVPAFNGQRMVREYTERCYAPAMQQVQRLVADDLAAAKSFADWRQRIEDCWSNVAIRRVEARSQSVLRVGESVDVQALVELGPLNAQEVAVQLYVGRVDARGELSDAHALPMRLVATEGRCATFEATGAAGDGSGLHGYTVRVLPRHAELASPFVPGLISWAPDAAR